MIETFVFDWSGTVSNDAPPVYEANMMLLEDHGHNRISFEEWRKLSALTAAGFLRNCGVECDERRTYERYKIYFNELVADGHIPKVIPGARDALESLSETGRRLLVLSSHPAANLRHEIQRYGMDGLFEGVIGSVVHKAVGLIGICNGLNVEGRNIVYWGDTIHDIEAAKEAGVCSGAIASEYAYHSRERLDAAKPDFVLGDISWMVGI